MTQLNKIIGDTFLYLSDIRLYPLATNFKTIEKYNLKSVAQIIINSNQSQFVISYLKTKILCNIEFEVENSEIETQLLEILETL